MTAHISVRLYWHDSGWNGAICRDPAGNTWCSAHGHVRTHKKVADEVRCAGQHAQDCGVLPACETNVQAFASRANRVVMHPPEWMASSVRPVPMDLEPASSTLWPYSNMWNEGGGHKPNDERRAIATEFIRNLTPGESLVLFYVDERNPVLVDDTGENRTRVLAGVSVVREVGDIVEYAEPVHGETHMVWGVPFSHAWPDQGFRFPLQELLAVVPEPEARRDYVVALDAGIRADFRWVANEVQVDRLAVVLERCLGALDRIRQDDVLPGRDFTREIKWLNEQLHRVWKQRGPYPGLGAILDALDGVGGGRLQACWVPEQVERGRDPVALFFGALEDPDAAEDSLEEWLDAIDEAADFWADLDAQEREFLRDVVSRVALEPEQVRRLLSRSGRVKHGLPEDMQDLIDNPYLLAEQYQPGKTGEPIPFTVIDHGLLPHEVMGRAAARVKPADPRRFRALLMEHLRAQADDGHTFVGLEDAHAAAVAASPENRRCDLALERLEKERVAKWLDPVFERFDFGGRTWLSLRSLRADELAVATRLDELCSRKPPSFAAVDWHAIERADALRDGREARQLSAEQMETLDLCLRSPVSLLTGAAGTGKSSLLPLLAAGIRQVEGEVRIEALAPTGKAARRLEQLNLRASTIHRALASAGWWDHEMVRFREASPQRIEANTLIIDEASMLDIGLLAALGRAVAWAGVARLVLVGDYHQLPPIGPGRPFYDLVARCQKADQEATGAVGDSVYAARLAELRTNFRVEVQGSRAIGLAQSFARRQGLEDPELWARVAAGGDIDDLRVLYWKDHEELATLLLQEVGRTVDRLVEDRGGEAPKHPFDGVLGHDERFEPSAWQLIAPVRGHEHGTGHLNALIQDEHHGWLKKGDRKRRAVRFGNQQVTWLDKVIQVSNTRREAWSRSSRTTERVQLVNGQLGLVTGTHPSHWNGERPKTLKIRFDGHEDLEVSYSSSAVDSELELAYAITVHKAQGSQFEHVICVLPRSAGRLMCRGLAYTALTRGQRSLTLLVQDDVRTLLPLRRLSSSAVLRRSSRLFDPLPGDGSGYRTDGLIHVSGGGRRVRSKSELLIIERLERLRAEGRLDFEYEQELLPRDGDPRDLRLPDFTLKCRGRTWYWEHCGMMDDPGYLHRWKTQRRPWYERHGYADQLIVTVDGPESGFDGQEIDRVLRERVLGEV